MTTDMSKNAAAPKDSVPEVVHVSAFGGDVKRSNFSAGHTVDQYLNDAGITVDQGQTVSLNGSPTTLDTVVESNPGTVNAIVVTNKVANGRH